MTSSVRPALCSHLAVRLSVLLGLLLPRSAQQGLGSGDIAPLTRLPAYYTADICVRFAVAGAIGSELLECNNDITPAPCLCATISPTITSAIYTSASLSCSGSSDGPRSSVVRDAVGPPSADMTAGVSLPVYTRAYQR